MAPKSAKSNSTASSSDAAKARPDSIQEALRVLDEALATQATPDLGELVTSDFTHLKSALAGASATHSSSSMHGASAKIQDSLNGVGDSIRHIGDSLSGFGRGISDTVRDYSGQTYGKVSHLATDSVDQARELGRKVDSNLRSNPWPVIGGVAVGTFTLGFLLGRRKGSLRPDLH